MNERCTFQQGKFNCGSYAFNLYKEGIEQGDLCDVHYWQDQAQKARADEREACAKVVENAMWFVRGVVAKAIRARSNT